MGAKASCIRLVNARGTTASVRSNENARISPIAAAPRSGRKTRWQRSAMRSRWAAMARNWMCNLSADGVVVVHHDFRLNAGIDAQGRALADRRDAADQGSELCRIAGASISAARDPGSDYALLPSAARRRWTARGFRPWRKWRRWRRAPSFLAVRGTEILRPIRTSADPSRAGRCRAVT